MKYWASAEQLKRLYGLDREEVQALSSRHCVRTIFCRNGLKLFFRKDVRKTLRKEA